MNVAGKQGLSVSWGCRVYDGLSVVRLGDGMPPGLRVEVAGLWSPVVGYGQSSKMSSPGPSKHVSPSSF